MKLNRWLLSVALLVVMATAVHAEYGYGRSRSSGNCGYFDNPVYDPSCGSGSYYVDKASPYWPPSYREVNSSLEFDYRYQYSDNARYTGLQGWSPYYYNQYGGNYYNDPVFGYQYNNYNRNDGYYQGYPYNQYNNYGYNNFNPNSYNYNSYPTHDYYDRYNNRRYGNYFGYPYSQYSSPYYGYGNSFGSYYDYLSPGYQYYGS
ncbi:hypothetical protein CMO91_00500 [Candidatus Woesearchaeota archaeon]|nr:hypothetical protein [Candidatus Woesearchaeota archaeon]